MMVYANHVMEQDTWKMVGIVKNVMAQDKDQFYGHKNLFFGVIDGIAYLNTTPHQINFGVEEHDEAIILPASGFIVNASINEKHVKIESGIEYVKTVFNGDPVVEEKLNKMILRIQNSTGLKNIVIIGSMIAAQAYPDKIVVLTPCKGYERVPITQKRMNLDKFTTIV